MSLLRHFFPEIARDKQLAEMAKAQNYRSRRDARLRMALEGRIADLENDLGYVALVLGSLLQKVDEKGVVTRDEVREAASVLDGIDGIEDGKIDVSFLKGLSES
ncbi:MAG: hypothetical protein AAF682_22075 [Planctomycetota bacterium]